MEEPTRAQNMNDAVRASLEEVARYAGENAAIGAPIETTAGITVIPVSRVSIGFVTGSMDTDSAKKADRRTFGGGGGTGISVTPMAFLAVSKERGAELISLTPSEGARNVDRVASLIENAPDLIRRLKNAIFSRSNP